MAEYPFTSPIFGERAHSIVKGVDWGMWNARKIERGEWDSFASLLKAGN